MFQQNQIRKEIREALSCLNSKNFKDYSKHLSTIVKTLESDEFQQYKLNYSKLAWKFPKRMSDLGLVEKPLSSPASDGVSLSPLQFPYGSFLFEAKTGIRNIDDFEMKLINLEGALQTMQLMDETMSQRFCK